MEAQCLAKDVKRKAVFGRQLKPVESLYTVPAGGGDQTLTLYLKIKVSTTWPILLIWSTSTAINYKLQRQELIVEDTTIILGSFFHLYFILFIDDNEPSKCGEVFLGIIFLKNIYFLRIQINLKFSKFLYIIILSHNMFSEYIYTWCRLIWHD